MRTKFKIGDRIKLHPNKRQYAIDINVIGFREEYTVVAIGGVVSPFCTVLLIPSGHSWNLYFTKIMKVGKSK